MSETEVTLRGHLGTNPELQTSASGKPWLRLRIATNRRIRTPEGWADGATSWYDVKLWGPFAQNAAESLRKGDRVLVQGPLEIEEYTTDKGVTFTTAVVHARALGPDLNGAVVRLTKVRRNEAGEVVAEGTPVDVSRMQEVDDDVAAAAEPPEDDDMSESEVEPAYATA